jgi:UDP-galactopyranose mutase
MNFDYVIVGAGFAGAVLAERIANVQNKTVLLVEKRNHIGGNAYDCYDENGILVHRYGPHIFHTKLKHIWDYLSQFTDWRIYHHRVLGSIDGKKVPIPFNLNTLYEVFPYSLIQQCEEKLVKEFGYNVKVPIMKLLEKEDEQLKYLANYVYEKIFLNYTNKQWGMSPSEIDSSVTARVPIYIGKDNRYFQDAYQGMPKLGYTKMFESMLANSNIKLLLNTDFKEIIQIKNSKTYLFGNEFQGKLIFTGNIDEFFGYRYGELPYRSTHFEFDSFKMSYYQECGTVNYPNEYDFTRITEFKHLTGQQSEFTSIMKEYPQVYDRGIAGKDIPMYPVPKKESIELYERYKSIAEQHANIMFIGRLAEYRYYDMDAVIDRAMSVFKNDIL